MKCINHPERDAAASCKICGKSLCPECANRFGQIPYCLTCEKTRFTELRDELKAELKRLTRAGIIFMIIGIICLIAAVAAALGSEPDFFSKSGLSFICILILYLLLAPYALFSIPFGWSTLNKITSDLFLFLPIVGWLIYFLIKFILSFYVGIFACPFIISKRKKNIKDLDSYLELLNRH